MASTPTSLAQHLRQAASLHPQATALLHVGDCLTFAELLRSSEELAGTIQPGAGVIAEAGDSLHLARHAYACSLLKRPFFPFDRCSSAPKLDLHQPEAALIIATSGSEGKPRAVLLGDAQLDAAAASANERLKLNTGDLWLNCLPLYHIGGQSILWRCARAGAAVLLHDGFTSARVAADLARLPVTHISLVPAMLAQLLEADSKPPVTLRCALIGGAALSRPLYDKAVAAGWPLCPSYGMSETAALLASFDPADGPWQEGLVGRPMPGHAIRIGDDGRLCIRGPQVMLGYADGSGVDENGWLTTGDLGQMDTAGRLTILGRADDMLISGGCNIHPQAIESCLADCPGVLDVAVSGQPDPVWGDLVVALVVGQVAPDKLLAHARRHLPSAALPRRIVSLDRLPRNAAGKLERSALRRLAAEAGA